MDGAQRKGWHCPSCGVNYSPDVSACSCSARPAAQQFPQPGGWMHAPSNCTCGPWNSITPPPPCPVHIGWHLDGRYVSCETVTTSSSLSVWLSA